MSWMIFIGLYLVTYVVFSQFYKLSTKNLVNAGALTILLEFMGSIVGLICIPFFKFSFPTDIKIYLLWGIALIFYTLVDRLNTTVRKGLEASTFSIISQLSTVFMTLSGFLFFKEDFVIYKFVGALLILVSNILIFYKKGNGKPNKYVVLGIIANLCFSVALFLDVNISDNFNLGLYAATSLGVPSILIMIFERISLKTIAQELKNGDKKVFMITSVTWTLAIIFQLKAYQLGNVSIVAPLCALSVILNVLVGYLFLKEKDNLLKKIMAAILIILGIVLIKI